VEWPSSWSSYNSSSGLGLQPQCKRRGGGRQHQSYRAGVAGRGGVALGETDEGVGREGVARHYECITARQTGSVGPGHGVRGVDAYIGSL
jgi:hypothetical protein